MTAAPVLISSAPRRIVGDHPLLEFYRRDDGHLKDWWRYLSVRGEAVFEVGTTCGTCQFWFERLEPEVRPLDIDAISGALAAGLGTLDEEVVEAFGRLLPAGDYQVALIRLTPERIAQESAEDYFHNAQTADWRYLDQDDWINLGTDFYRPAARSGFAVDGGLGFEFFVPMQPPESLDEARIAFFGERLAGGATPTAVAVGLLDLKQHYASKAAHWCLAHFLIDGHHKVEAAARAGRPVTLLSFIAHAAGLSLPEHVDRMLAAAYARETKSTA